MKNPIDGEVIRTARKELGLTPKQLAAAMGVSSSCVTNWEVGRNGINRKNFFRLCRILELDPSEANMRSEERIEPDDNGAADDLVVEVISHHLDESDSTPLLEPGFDSSKKPLLLSVPRHLLDGLRAAAQAQYRTLESQALWSIQMTLEAEGYVGTDHGEDDDGEE